eukprot:GFUD01099849.1.p1 GENE.GFUD01099849.1~~GFUD01099849.1.p1  ORF type:complete len:136 (-),score=24.78 GFUD01099849.1:362-769(-)
MCKAEIGDKKHKLDSDIVLVERQLEDLRTVRNTDMEVELGKARMLGLEVISSLASLRNHILLLSNCHLSTHQASMLEQATAQSIELGLDLPQNIEEVQVEWTSLTQNWLKIVFNAICLSKFLTAISNYPLSTSRV